MKIPKGLTDFVKVNEGFRAAAYKDGAGVWTVGYGFTGTLSDGRKVDDGLHISEEFADKELEMILSELCRKIRLACGFELTYGQMTALADFAYNFGYSQLLTSSLLRKFRAGDTLGASMEFQKWSLINGKRSKGLLLRRWRDAAAFLS